MEIIFVTTNDEKWRIALRTLKGYPIELKRLQMETPEIQSTEVEEIAGYSSEYAANKLKKSVMVTDGGYYISALNGFPGPFQKYMNKWLTPDDFINLMKPHDDRSVQLKTCIAFCEPGGKPVCFTSVVNAKIAQKPEGQGSILDQIVILEGFEKPQGAYEIDEIRKHWAGMLSHYRQLGEYIRQRYETALSSYSH
ncbi:MAG: non-canonical purine NTP pyrophosphatase [Chloroflexota bacterium]